MSYLQSILRFSGVNLGGVLSIKLARKSSIVSIPEPVDGVIYGDIEFEDGFGWTQWDATFESANLTTSDRESREGFFVNNSLPFRLPKDVPGVREMLLKASDDEFIVLIQDANGQTKIFGLLETPVRFSFAHGTGGELVSGNFFNCRFFYEGPDNVYFYDGEVESAPAGAAPALVKFKLFGQLDSEAQVIGVLSAGQTLMIVSDFGFNDFYVIQ